MSGPAHVLVLRPIIGRLGAADEIEVTACEYTQARALSRVIGGQ